VFVHQPVGPVEEFPGVRGYAGHIHPGAYGQGKGIGKPIGFLPEDGFQCPAGGQIPFFPGIRGGAGEFVPSQPEAAGGGSEGFPDPAAADPDGLIPSLVSELIVDHFEIIDVHEDQAERGSSRAHQLVHMLFKGRPVSASGDNVPEGQGLQQFGLLPDKKHVIGLTDGLQGNQGQKENKSGAGKQAGGIIVAGEKSGDFREKKQRQNPQIEKHLPRLFISVLPGFPHQEGDQEKYRKNHQEQGGAYADHQGHQTSYLQEYVQKEGCRKGNCQSIQAAVPALKNPRGHEQNKGDGNQGKQRISQPPHQKPVPGEQLDHPAFGENPQTHQGGDGCTSFPQKSGHTYQRKCGVW